jgi:hypothetical protein
MLEVLSCNSVGIALTAFFSSNLFQNQAMQTTSTKGAPSRSNKFLKYIGSYIKYKFDSLFAHGLVFIIPLLITITTLIVLIFSVIYYYTENIDNYPDALWGTFTRVLDPCAAAQDEGLKNRIISGIVIIWGLVITAILIGTIATFMEEKLNDLKKRTYHSY